MYRAEWGCELKGATRRWRALLLSPFLLQEHTCLSQPAALVVTGKGKEGQREALGGDRLQSEISMGVLAVHTPFTEVRKIPYWKQFLRPC